MCAPGILNMIPEIDMKCTERYKERKERYRRERRLGNTIEKRFGDTIQYTILSSKSLCICLIANSNACMHSLKYFNIYFSFSFFFLLYNTECYRQ